MMKAVVQSHPYNSIFRLTKEQKENPFEVLKEFCSNINLFELRTLFDRIFETCLATNEGAFSIANERGSLLFTCKEMEKLFEAVFLIAKLREQAND
jgi:hypothetical protein